MNEQAVITSGDLTARIDPLGAELVSLTDSAGAEWLTSADPAFWTGHAPLLFPIVGRLAGDVLRVDGRAYPMKQHGFARRMAWEMVQLTSFEVAFELRDSTETLAQFPYAFNLTVEYALRASTLGALVRIANPGAVPLPCSFGFHPAFAWPLPGGGDKAGHRIEFEHDEPQDVRRLNAEGLLAASAATPVARRALLLDPALFAADALVWDRLASRRLSYRSHGGPWLEVVFDLPQLGIWQKPGANFICIEPWAGHADPAGYLGEFSNKPGIVTLAPGDERSFRMDVTLHPR